MGAPLIVETCYVDEIIKHPNADRLDIVKVKGWYCIVAKDSIQFSDLIVYIPIDSVIPDKLERIVFADSKIKPENGRIRTIKIRGSISQGLVIPVHTLKDFYDMPLQPGWDVKDLLGITKFEPKEQAPYTVKNGHQASKKQINPNFRKYTDINHLKNYPDIFEDDEEVIITEKIHGTNFRAGYVPIYAPTFFKRMIKKIFSFFNKKNFKYPGYEFVFGSHNIQLQEKNKKAKRSNIKHFKKNVYEEIVDKYNLREILKPGEVIYGEIYGANIQKNYDYGLKNDIDLVVFDLMRNGEYQDFSEVIYFSFINSINFVPIIKNELVKYLNFDEFVSGPSTLCPDQKVREGIVVRPIKEKKSHMGRIILKYINPEYLLNKNNTDWH